MTNVDDDTSSLIHNMEVFTMDLYNNLQTVFEKKGLDFRDVGAMELAVLDVVASDPTVEQRLLDETVRALDAGLSQSPWEVDLCPFPRSPATLSLKPSSCWVNKHLPWQEYFETVYEMGQLARYRSKVLGGGQDE